MKKLLFALLWCISGAGILSSQVFEINGSTNDIHWVECSQITVVDYTYSTLINFESPGDTFVYTFYLIYNGDAIDQVAYTTGSGFVACPILPCAPIPVQFVSSVPESGQYHVVFTVEEKIGNSYSQVYYDESNTIEITRPDDGYGACFGNESSETETRCEDEMEIYQFIPGTSLVVFKEEGLIYKLGDLGSTGYNMYALTDPIGNVPGYNFYQGHQDFEQSITDLVYTSDGYLLIGFRDGKILKIAGLGGTGQNMFAVNETAGGFTSVPGYSYYVGHHKFNNGITDISHIQGYTMISFADKKILKVNGSGGSGMNLFAIVELANQFQGIYSYPYFVGSAKYNSPVINMYHYAGQTIVAFQNGKLLKVNGTGGSGMNFFAVNETGVGFVGIGLYPYYVGAAKFDGRVKDMMYQGGQLTLGFSNGKLLKVNGLGGTGLNMFSIIEHPWGFSNIGLSPYYAGTAKYSGEVENILFAGTSTFITFSTGKLMKVSNVGGTGINMYNATEVSNGFITSSTVYTQYLLGSSNFDVKPTDIKLFGQTNLVLCFANLKMFKAIDFGGTGMNCFATVQQNEGFRPLLEYKQYVTGTQVFCSQKRDRSMETEIEEEPISNTSISCYPNPTTGKTTVELKDFDEEANYQLYVMGVNGQLISEQRLTSRKIEIDLSGIPSGIYFIQVNNGLTMHYAKVIKVD